MTDVKQLEKNLIFVIGILVILTIIGGIITVAVFLWRKRNDYYHKDKIIGYMKTTNCLDDTFKIRNEN